MTVRLRFLTYRELLAGRRRAARAAARGRAGAADLLARIEAELDGRRARRFAQARGAWAPAGLWQRAAGGGDVT